MSALNCVQVLGLANSIFLKFYDLNHLLCKD